MEFERAVRVFALGFARGKSRTHPYLAEDNGGLWHMRDGPGKRGSPRAEEISVYGRSPEEAVAFVRREVQGRHFIGHLYPELSNFDSIRAAYKSLGYRTMLTEWLFIHDLIDIPELQSDPPVRHLETAEEWSSIQQRFKGRHVRKLSEHARLFAIYDAKQDYGWVESVPLGEDAWVAGLYVHSTDRGRGFGLALMSQMLMKDRACGVRQSVLLASRAGARLYPHLGYRQIGELQLFAPVKEKS
ncbi:MAG: GNAT family N-acetyltransferase [Armatimonadetes bacterium]|nr:GNAT family N-acetyltransferase [Armatimonadota bacterium]